MIRAVRRAGAAAAALAAVALSALLLAGCSGGAGAGATTSPMDGAADASIALTDATAGECLNSATAANRVLVVACNGSHSFEVFASFTVADGDYSADGLSAEVQPTCVKAFSDFVGIDYQESGLTLRWVAPNADAWAAGDRRALCVLFSPDGKLLSSMRGKAR